MTLEAVLVRFLEFATSPVPLRVVCFIVWLAGWMMADGVLGSGR